VINDEITENDMQKFLFRMATPEEIELSIVTIAQAAEMIKGRLFDEKNTILLLKCPEDVYRLYKTGGKIGEVNVGGMHFSENKFQLFDAIFVNEDDVHAFRLLAAEGVVLEVRMVPTDAKKDIIKAINEKYGE